MAPEDLRADVSADLDVADCSYGSITIGAIERLAVRSRDGAV
jgi:hypothetical protein